MGKDLKGKELGKGITQRKNGCYVGRFTDRFGNRPQFTSYNLSEVRADLTKAKYEDEQKLNICDSKMTLDEWYVKWMNIYKYGIIKENTKAGYISFYKKHIKPCLGERRIAEITHLQILDFINGMDRDGYGFETKNRARIMLMDMFSKAMIDNFIKKNPVKGIKIVRDEEKDPRVMTKEEQSEFFDCCKGTFYDNLFTVCVNTGLRPGEACALTEADIDFNRKRISVNKTLIYQKWEGDTKKTIHIDTPKTKRSGRKIPMNKHAELALKKQILQKRVMRNRWGLKRCNKQFEDILFTTKFNTPIIEQVFCDAVKRILDEINSMRDSLEEFEAITPHTFRHTFATRSLEGNMKPKVLQKILGHATLQMTMDLYAHVLPDLQVDEMKLLEEEMAKVNGMADDMALKRFENTKDESGKIITLSAG